MRSLAQEFGVRDATGRDHHHIRIFGEHFVGLGVGVVPDIDVDVFALSQPPVDDPDQVPPPR